MKLSDLRKIMYGGDYIRLYDNKINSMCCCNDNELGRFLVGELPERYNNATVTYIELSSNCTYIIFIDMEEE